MAKSKTRWYRFHIQSSRGTDHTSYVKLPYGLSKEEIKDELEEWCRHFGCWDSSENCITYEWDKVRKPPKSYTYDLYGEPHKNRNTL
jgi:hypothetical protein